VFRCPACLGVLSPAQAAGPYRAEVGELSCRCGRVYPVRAGIPDLVYPSRLATLDRKFLAQYERHAGVYDRAVSALFTRLGSTEDEFRSWMVGLLPPQHGGRILEVSCGTGSNFRYLLRRAGPRGRLIAIDLSPSMIDVARTKTGARRSRVTLARANGAHLPFSDGFFDAVFHFGGVNSFSELPRALSEMARVVRPGGRVVLGDEGLAPWRIHTPYGRALRRENPLYESQPPLAHLPATARDVALRWVLKDAFYVLSFSRGRPL
jgi:SAM-dependent methyltransferase